MNIPRRRHLLLPLALALAAVSPGLHAQAAARKPQFVYMLRVASAYQDQAAWTDVVKSVVGRHLARLKQATQDGQVIMAGRSEEALDKTFGLVVFEAENEAAARRFMQTDPAVEAGVMTASLHPYVVATLRRSTEPQAAK